MLILVVIGLLCTQAIIQRLILTVLKSNKFQTKSKKLIGNKNITTNIFRIQPHDSVMCGYFCTGFIGFMLKGKSLIDFTDLFSQNNFKHNDKIIFQ